MEKSSKKIAIIAGNPRFENNDGEYVVDPQIIAFARALYFARIFRASGRLGSIHMLVDHIGKFDERFLDQSQKLTQKNKKYPRLAHVAPKILDYYQPALDSLGCDPKDIHLITEGQCRMAVLQRSEKNPEIIGDAAGIVGYGANKCREGLCITNQYDPDKLRVTCTGIAAEAYRRAARYGEEVMCFVEYDKVRCPRFVFNDAIKAAHEHFGVTGEIEVQFV